MQGQGSALLSLSSVIIDNKEAGLCHDPKSTLLL